jgi:hypothetical protein
LNLIFQPGDIGFELPPLVVEVAQGCFKFRLLLVKSCELFAERAGLLRQLGFLLSEPVGFLRDIVQELLVLREFELDGGEFGFAPPGRSSSAGCAPVLPGSHSATP